MIDDTPDEDTQADETGPSSRREGPAGDARGGRIDVAAGLLGFHRWHLPVVLLAGTVTAWPVVPADPIAGLLGLVVALIGWASVVKLLQYLNDAVSWILGDRRLGFVTVRLYCLAALLGLASVTVELFLASPSPWSRLTGRFTPEIAIYGFFVLGTLLAIVLVAVKSIAVFASRFVASGA